MKRLKFCTTILIINILNNITLSQNDSTVAVTELQRMNTTFGYNIKMNITREGQIVSLPNQEIQLSLAELRQISSVTQKSIRLYIVRFIVAHEFAHQMQYYRYANNLKFMNNDLTSKTLIETQADIMAGLVFFQMSPEIFIYQDIDPQLVNNIFKEIFIVTHNMGIRENTLGSHPSKRDRMLAVRLGLLNGFNFVYDQWVKSDPARAIQNGITPKIFKKQMDEHFKFIDLKNDEDMILWSYRQAKKIVNYDRNITTNIVLLTPLNERIIWHEQASKPYVDYKLTYKNISNRSIDMEMEVFVAHVNRIESYSPENYKKINVDHYKFSLRPNKSRTIKGKLLWLKNENDVLGSTELRAGDMPRIVYPGMSTDDGIYSCSYTDDLSDQVYQENIAILNFQSSNELIRFPSFFNTLLNICRFNYQDAIKGIGEVSLNSPNEITYVSSLQLDDETLTMITVDNMKKISTVELLFPFFYSDRNSMLAYYTEIKKQLYQELEDSRIEEGQIGENLWINYSSPKYNTYLQTMKNEKTQQYSIKLSIFFN